MVSCVSTKREIPQASSFVNPRKVGLLKRLTGKGWIYSGCWKERYCVLDSTKLYFYDNQDSQGREKTAGVISLDYYDLCEEGNAKDHRRASNVFAIGTSVRGFFDNRHLFSADTLEECKEWIREINNAIEEARGNRSRAGRLKTNHQKNAEFKDENLPNEGGRNHNEIDVPASDLLYNVTKERSKGPTGRRLPQRKSMMNTTKTVEKDVPQRSTSLSALDEIAEDQENRYSNSDDSANDRETVPLVVPEVKLHKTEQNAFLQELEMRVGVNKRHSSKAIVSPNETESDDKLLTIKNSVEVMRSRMTLLGTHVEHVERNVSNVQKDLNKVQQQLASNEAKSDKVCDQTSAMEKRLNSALEEMHIMCKNAQQALQEAQDTRNECYSLKEEVKEMLLNIKDKNDKAIMELIETI